MLCVWVREWDFLSWHRLLFCKQVQNLRRKHTRVEVYRVNLFNVRAWLARGGRKEQWGTPADNSIIIQIQTGFIIIQLQTTEQRRCKFLCKHLVCWNHCDVIKHGKWCMQSERTEQGTAIRQLAKCTSVVSWPRESAYSVRLSKYF
jgi:hypothetical protein